MIEKFSPSRPRWAWRGPALLTTGACGIGTEPQPQMTRPRAGRHSAD